MKEVIVESPALLRDVIGWRDKNFLLRLRALAEQEHTAQNNSDGGSRHRRKPASFWQPIDQSYALP
jgi:hypothetical protein